MTKHDDIFSQPLAPISDFQFDRRVVDVFPDMIQRSVPGYDEVIRQIGILALTYVQPNSLIFDLGCSLGAASLVIRQWVGLPSCRIVAVDNSEAMVTQFRRNIEQLPGGMPIAVEWADIRDTIIENASFVVLNYTLQFIDPDEREKLIHSIWRGMNSGGALILSEKIRMASDPINAWIIDLHHSFKKANGYSDLEIAQKRTALEKTLIPETVETHLNRLRKVGFKWAEVWFQCYNFVSMIAVKV